MNEKDFAELKPYDHVKLQFDDDPEFEEGAIIAVRKTYVIVCGHDEQKGTFYAPIRAADIIEKVTPKAPEPEIDVDAIIDRLRVMDNNLRAMITNAEGAIEHGKKCVFILGKIKDMLK